MWVMYVYIQYIHDTYSNKISRELALTKMLFMSNKDYITCYMLLEKIILYISYNNSLACTIRISRINPQKLIWLAASWIYYHLKIIKVNWSYDKFSHKYTLFCRAHNNQDNVHMYWSLHTAGFIVVDYSSIVGIIIILVIVKAYV